MKSCSEDIKDMLEYYLMGSSSEGPSDFVLFGITIGKEPALPTNMISIFETVGYRPQLAYNKTEKYEYPSVQLRIRANSYTEGYEQAQQIKETLHGRAHETWNGSFYSLIYCLNGPFLLDYDKNQHPRFVVNFNIQRR